MWLGLEGGLHDPGIALRPVMPVAREQADAIAIISTNQRQKKRVKRLKIRLSTSESTIDVTMGK